MAGKLKKFIIPLLALFMMILQSVPVLAANEPNFNIDMDSLNLQKGVSTSLIITLENAEGAKIISIEGIDNFDILSRSQGTSTSIVGGNISHEEYQYYQIMPKTTGQFSLKAIIQYNDQSYETNILEVTISDGPSDNETKTQDLFVETLISHTDAYLGEKVVITYVLYTRYDIESLGFVNYTSIDGVIAKEMPSDQLKSESVYIDGIRYAKYEVKQLIIDPMKSGSYTIPSFNLQVNVITNNNPGGMFGGFGGLFSYSEPMYLQTEEKELFVKPLPTEGKPVDFSGIVGELSISGRYNKEEVNYNDSLSLLITASGNCNLDGFKSIFTGEISGFNVYETSKNVVETIENNQYHIEKELEAILVPKLTGDLQVMPVSISYFNPATGKYEIAMIPGADIKVVGDMPISSNADSQAALIETIRIDQVNYSSANISADYIIIPIKKQTVYSILIVFTVLFILAIVLVRLFIKRKKQDVVVKSIYKQVMKAKDINEVYSCFCNMINHCYKLSLKANPIAFVKSRLPNDELAEQVSGIMEYMESSEEKRCSELKDKVSSVYRMILLRR